MNPFRRLWVIIKARFSRLVDPAKKRVQSRKQKLEAQVMKLDKAAHDAVRLGKEDEARKFLERKQFLQDELDGVDREVVELQNQQEHMIKQEREVQAQVERFRTEKEVSKAQYSAA